MSEIKRSCEFGAGTYQYEWHGDKIAVAKWDKPPASSMQWVTIEKPGRYYLEGTCDDDLRVVRVNEALGVK